MSDAAGGATGGSGPERAAPHDARDHADLAGPPGAAGAAAAGEPEGYGAADRPAGGFRPRFTRRARRNIVTLASVVVVYYALPVGRLPSGAGVALSVIGLLVGVSLLAWSIVRQFQRLVHGDPHDPAVRLDSVIFLVYLVVPLFALGYFALEQADSSQFASLTTKTDALYFTLSTLATVGFGDVHATDQLARGLVTIQIAFDLVFVAALVSLLTTQIRERAATRIRERAAGEGGSGGQPPPVEPQPRGPS